MPDRGRFDDDPFTGAGGLENFKQAWVMATEGAGVVAGTPDYLYVDHTSLGHWGPMGGFTRTSPGGGAANFNTHGLYNTIQTNGVINNQCYIQHTQNNCERQSGAVMMLKCQPHTSIANLRIFIGMGTTPTPGSATPANWQGIRFDDVAGDANYQLYHGGPAGQTVVPTTLVPAIGVPIYAIVECGATQMRISLYDANGAFILSSTEAVNIPILTAGLFGTIFTEALVAAIRGLQFFEIKTLFRPANALA
jgi:hypothetical protein